MVPYRLCVFVICLLVAHASKVEHVEDLNFEPRIAIKCGEVPQHMDTNSGRWIKGEKEFCPKDAKEILQYCQTTFPNIDVTNVVVSNNNVTLCDDDNCETQITVLPYRCLIGKFEADALIYSPDADCIFGYVHDNDTCKSHDYWRDRGLAACEAKEKKLDKYGVLLACGINLYTGVEYVCCKEEQTPLELFEELLKEFSNHIPAVSEDCDRSKYELKQRALEVEKRIKVRKVAKELQAAKDRMKLLKQDDSEQAQSMYKDELNTLQRKLEHIETEAGLDEAQLHQGRRECIQISANYRKHIAMKSFVNAIRNYSDKPLKIIKTFKAVMRSLDRDQAMNARFLSRLLHSKKSLAESARKRYGPHFELLRTTLKKCVDLLRHFDDVRGKVDFDLPAWANDIDFKWAHETIVEAIFETEATTEPSTEPSTTVDPEALRPENEHEDFGDHPLKSRAVFAAVIGLSCGALVIMIVIVLALFFRKGSSKRPTKTVVAEDETQEQRHLLKMQEDGFENPTYKFFVH